jgi:hypothetical protein
MTRESTLICRLLALTLIFISSICAQAQTGVSGSGNGGTAQCVNMSGTWNGTDIATKDGTVFKDTMVLVAQGCSFSGTYTTCSYAGCGSGTVSNGTINGSVVNFRRLEPGGYGNCQGGPSDPAQFWTGTLSADGLSMSGTVSQPSCSGIGDTFSTSRPAVVPTLSLTLSQSTIAPSVPSQTSSTTATAALTDGQGNPLSSITVDFSAVPFDLIISGHLHTNVSVAPAGSFEDPSAAQSTLTCTTDVTGSCQLNYIAPEVGGNYQITATATGISSLSDTKPITVQLALGTLLGGGDVVLTGNSGNTTYAGCPGTPILHSNNHNGIDDMVINVGSMAVGYYLQQGVRLGINDMSLPWGGLFDICNNWATPHSMHRSGTSVDIDHAGYDANGNSTGAPIDVINVLDIIANQLSLFRIPEGGSIHYELYELPF